MPTFWQKLAFWIVCFVVLLVSIPVSFFYLSKYFTRPTPQAPSPSTQSQSPTPTVAKPGSCLIVEEKYCSQAKAINGQPMKMIGLRLPVGVPLFLPSDSQVPKTKLNESVVFFKGYRADLFDPGNPKALRYSFSGDIKFNDMLTLNMKKGEIFGYTQDTGIDMVGYNLIFYAYEIGPDKHQVINEEVMKKMFPTLKL